MDAFLDALQWPAMIVTLAAAWLVASQTQRKRHWGFWCFILSNILWIIWGWHDRAYALIALQVGLFALNLRGARKNDPKKLLINSSREPLEQQANHAELEHSLAIYRKSFAISTREDASAAMGK